MSDDHSYEIGFVDELTDATPPAAAAAVDAGRLRRLAGHVLGAEGAPADTEVTIVAVDPSAIADLNKEYLGRDGPTDVLAFPIDAPGAPDVEMPLGAGVPKLLGDVLVCPDVALGQARRHGSDPAAEVDLLCVHGLLHLLGYDHVVDAEAEQMEARERELLAAHRTGAGR